MKIHEYQGKQLLREAGVPVPQSQVVFDAASAATAAKQLIEATGNDIVVVKSQIHAGGRGKGRFKEHPDLGGVKVVKGAAAAAEAAEKMLGSTLVTIQTGAEGKRVNRLLIEQGMDIKQELYLGVTLDRETGRNTVMASTEGGTEIEEVAHATPEKILTETIDPAIGLGGFQGRKLAYALGLEGKTARTMASFLSKVVSAYDKLDCSLLEINPLVITGDGQVLALDAKANFDDNALYRHPAIEELRDPEEEDAAELEAKKAAQAVAAATPPPVPKAAAFGLASVATGAHTPALQPSALPYFCSLWGALACSSREAAALVIAGVRWPQTLPAAGRTSSRLRR